MEENNKFAQRFKYLRKVKGLTAKDMARVLKVSASTIYKWESGRVSPKVNKIYLISVYFCVRADYLLGLKRNAKPYNEEKILLLRKNIYGFYD